ncbi:MAG: site-specific DNA-methyltransferase [Chloroflexi bacterium]|nr:site-specific DNA-methyltransferase [Chloroflexota bacterium]
MNSKPFQPYLPTLIAKKGSKTKVKHKIVGQANKLKPQDRAFHDWYRFVLSFPPHLVQDYIEDFELEGHHTVLDPFCGTGTTLVEAKSRGIQSIGIEANPFAHFASSIKIAWNIDPDGLETHARDIGDKAFEVLRTQGIDDKLTSDGNSSNGNLRKLSPQAERLLIKNSISPVPLHKILVLLDCIRAEKDVPYFNHELLALANSLVYSISNLRFGPEVGVGVIKQDASVITTWLSEITKMAGDLRLVLDQPYPEAKVYLADARDVDRVLNPVSIDAVITSPPYPNEKDYSRTTRLESVILGFIENKTELRASKKNFVRSNTRGVYKDDTDGLWVSKHAEIQRLAEKIENRRIEMGKTSGFEKLYARVTRLYFGGMARHLANLRAVLRPGAKLAYVVGDQASYLRIMIRTGQLLADLAQMLGYEVVRTDLFRTRFATATKEELREEVVILRWLG